MVNSRTARRVESIFTWEGGSLFRAVHCYSFLISLSSLFLNHLCSFSSILDLVCLAPHREHDAKGSECWRTCTIMYMFQPGFFFFYNLHSIKQWTDFPQRNFTIKSQAKPMICFLSPFAFSFFWLFQGRFSSACFVTPSVLLYHCGSVPASPCHTPGSLRMSQVPISMFLPFYHTQPSLSGLVLHGWSHGGFFKASIAMKTSLQKSISLFSDNVDCSIG